MSTDTPIDKLYKEMGDVHPGSSLEAALYHADEAYRTLERSLALPESTERRQEIEA